MAGDAKQIAAVRKVLYEPKRQQRMAAQLRSIAVLMNLDPERQLPANDVRVVAGSGPTWFVVATGRVSPAVTEAASRCTEVARVLLEIRRDLATVDVPVADKRRLRAALAAQAKAWQVRGRLWRAPGKPDADAAATAIAAQGRVSERHLAPVKRYLRLSSRGGS